MARPCQLLWRRVAATHLTVAATHLNAVWRREQYFAGHLKEYYIWTENNLKRSFLGNLNFFHFYFAENTYFLSIIITLILHTIPPWCAGQTWAGYLSLSLALFSSCPPTFLPATWLQSPGGETLKPRQTCQLTNCAACLAELFARLSMWLRLGWGLKVKCEALGENNTEEKLLILLLLGIAAVSCIDK